MNSRSLAAELTGLAIILLAWSAILLGISAILLALISLLLLGVLYFLENYFTLLIDLATTLSFLTAPVLAYINY